MADDPISEEYRAKMNQVAGALDDFFNPSERTTGFALFIFEFGATSRINYISNAQREDMMKAVSQWLAQQNEGSVQ